MNKQNDYEKISATIDSCKRMEQLKNCEILFDSYEFMYGYDEDLKKLIQQYFRKLTILIINTREYEELQAIILDDLTKQNI